MSLAKRMEEIKLAVPWGHIAGKTWGSPQATRVLVVHGIMDNAGSFDRIIPMLPDNFYYVVIDLPGHGLSSPLPLGTTLDYLNYIMVIRLVLDALKWDNCIYLGHSFGSQLGVFYSILYPGRITKIACLDGFLPAPVRNNEIIEKIRERQDISVLANTAKSPPLYTRDEVLYALKNKRNFPLNSQAAEALFDRATTKVGDLYKYNRDFRLRVLINPLFNISQYVEIVKHFKIPILVVLAESSWFAGEVYQKWLDPILSNMSINYTLVRVRGNHDVHNNNPETVAPHVSAFLNDTGKSKL